MEYLLYQTWTSESSRCESVQKSGCDTIGCLPPTPTYPFTVIWGSCWSAGQTLKNRFSTFQIEALLGVRSANPVLSGKMSVVVCAMPTWVSWKLGAGQEDKTVGENGVGVGVRAEKCQRSEVF